MTTNDGENHMTERDVRRFWAKADTSGGPAACWMWCGHTDRHGHGQFCLDGRAVGAHRVAYELATGQPIPPGQVVRHRCNQPGCVNPAHLVLGTHADNVADRVAAGRSARGEHNGRHKLTLDAVQHIRAARGTVPPAELAQRFNVTRRAVTLIWQGVNWRDA